MCVFKKGAKLSAKFRSRLHFQILDGGMGEGMTLPAHYRNLFVVEKKITALQ